jgi:hypothetical protein
MRDAISAQSYQPSARSTITPRHISVKSNLQGFAYAIGSGCCGPARITRKMIARHAVHDLATPSLLSPMSHQPPREIPE